MSRTSALVALREAAPLILPSLLLCDFGNLEREIERLDSAGVRALHLDVMDGNFVPNFTYGMPIAASIHKISRMPLDIHLMIANPGRYVEQFYTAGASLITIHAEAVDDPPALLQTIRELGAGAGIAVNPQTPLSEIEDCVGHADLVLIMSVQAGFGGQGFNDVALEKLTEARSMFGPDVILEVDGGINEQTISACTAAGADWCVVGSAIFRQSDYSDAVQRLLEAAGAANTN